MPRGKRTVFAGFCTDCGMRTSTVRLHRQKGAKSWKDFGPTKKQYLKFCGGCRKRTSVKLKEEKHSSS